MKCVSFSLIQKITCENQLAFSSKFFSIVCVTSHVFFVFSSAFSVAFKCLACLPRTVKFSAPCRNFFRFFLCSKSHALLSGLAQTVISTRRGPNSIPDFFSAIKHIYIYLRLLETLKQYSQCTKCCTICSKQVRTKYTLLQSISIQAYDKARLCVASC